MYDTLSTIIHEARQHHLHPILTGDFNAQVGKRDENDTTTSRGKFALEPSNSRGDWLTSWAASQHLILTNTYFEKQQADIITYYSPSRQARQIDYILTDKPLWQRTRDAHSCQCPDLGSDHNAVRLRLDLSTKTPKPRKRPSATTKQTTQWPPHDYKQFRSCIDDELNNCTITNPNDHYSQITAAISRAAQRSTTTPERHHNMHQHDDTLQQLIDDRRQLPPASPQRRAISLAIRKQLRRTRRQQQEDKIEQIIQNHRGLRHIADIKRHHAQSLIPSMTTSTNTTTTDRQSIADVFATFYEELYRRRPQESDANTITNTIDNNAHDDIPPFSLQEIDKAIHQLRSGKCKDTNGLIAEMLKTGGPTLRSHLQRLYNDVLSPNAAPPAQWKYTSISVIFKSGDAQLPNNYRPIAIIPLLYKLFARLLYNRLEPHLDAHQSHDQAGFRHNYSTDDHLFTTTILHERSQEWQLPLWVSAIDFKKAFDTIDHNQLWQALRNQQLPPQYIHLLQSLYSDQTATVKTDQLSRQFHIQRGVKQGDPLSSLLFNALLEDIFKTLKQRWTSRRHGIRLGHTDVTLLTNLRFADDVLLFATTAPQLTKMLNDLHDVARRCGLELHPDKTVILCNLSERRGRQATKSVEVGGRQVKVLAYDDATKYLGRKLTFHNHQTTEIDNRIATAWRKFNALRDVLTNKRYPLNARIRLFNTTITPTVLYGSTSWTTTKTHTTQLQSTQRRMMRLIVGTPRRHTTSSAHLHNHHDAINDTTAEPWPAYIQRATHIAERQLHNLKVESWTTTYWRRKWRWAARIAAQDHNRWSRRAIHWEPQYTDSRRTARRQARPCTRWDDIINAFLRSLPQFTTEPKWTQLATDATSWGELEDDFITFATTTATTKATNQPNTTTSDDN